MEQSDIRAETRWVEGTLGQKHIGERALDQMGIRTEACCCRGCWSRSYLTRSTLGQKHVGAEGVEAEDIRAESL